MPRDLPENQTDNIRNWLRDTMRRHGLGYGDVYTMTGVREGTLRRLLHEDNPTANIQKATVTKIAKGFGLNPGDLFDHAEGRRSLPIPDIIYHPEAEPLDRQVRQLRGEVDELRQTLARIVARLEE